MSSSYFSKTVHLHFIRLYISPLFAINCRHLSGSSINEISHSVLFFFLFWNIFQRTFLPGFHLRHFSVPIRLAAVQKGINQVNLACGLDKINPVAVFFLLYAPLRCHRNPWWPSGAIWPNIYRHLKTADHIHGHLVTCRFLRALNK